MSTAPDRIDEEQAAFDRADMLAADLRRLADMVSDNLTVAEVVASQLRPRYEGDESTRLLLPVEHLDDPVAAMREFVRTGLDAGVEVDKHYDDKWGAVNLSFSGGLRLHVYATRERVCTRVVTGTREVTEEVPDPDALAAVPTVTVTKTVEDVEWDCRPILAEQVSA